MKLDEKKIKKLSSNLSTPLSEISYILLAYALFTDGNVSEEENQAAIQITLDLGNDWNYEQEDIVSAYGEASEVCNGASKEELQAVFIDVLAKLDHQEDFKIAQRKKLIGYLESIMDADGVQHKNEIFYLDKIKELLKLEEDDSAEDMSKEITNKMLEDGYTGQGTYTWTNGNKYAGEWKHGKMHGFGITEIPDSDIYKGEYKENYKDGFGELTWPDGDSYIGEFSNGKMNGKGIFKTGDKEYSGTYKDDKLISKDPSVDFSLKIRNIVLQKEHGVYEEKETGDLNKAIEKMHDGSLFEEKVIHPKTEKTVKESSSSVYEIISKGIQNSKALPNQPFIKEELENQGFKNLPKHDPWLYIDEVTINEMKGFLFVNMDGFYSNCMNPEEITFIMTWDNIYNLQLFDSHDSERKDMAEGLINLLLSCDENENPDEAMVLSLFIEGYSSKTNSPFSVIKSIYDNIWKKMIDKYRGEPIIWGSHIDWFTKEVFASKEEFISFYIDVRKDREALEKLGTTKKDIAEKVLKNIAVSQENPEAYAFVKAVSAKGAKMQDILTKYELIFDDHINFADEDGYTAMHYACWDNKPIILQMLIDFGANPNVLSPTNETPLNMAVVSGHFDIVKFFVDYDIKFELNTEWEKRNTTPNPFHPEKGSTLIRDALLNQHWDIFDLLINGIAPNLDVLTEPCSVGFEGETNFFLAIKKLYQSKNIDYDKERLETIRSTVEGSSNQETNNEERTVSDENRSTLDRITFFLLSFAQNDGIVKEEIQEVASIIESLLGDSFSFDKFKTGADWFQTEMEKVEWNREDKGLKAILKECIAVVEDFFGKSSSPEKRFFINQVIGIANADGQVGKSEIDWIERLCKGIDIEIPNILDKDPERRWDVEEEDSDSDKGYPMITVRVFKDKDGDDTEKQKLVKEYMMNWHEPTEEYNGRMGITARIPDFFESINKNCPKWTSDEITNIKNYITKYKVIPTLRYAPEEFNNWTKQVWWLAPFVFWNGNDGEIASWLFIDKNGFQAAHPSDNEGALIFNWDIITDVDTDWLEDNLVMLTLYGEHNGNDIELRFCEVVSEGNGSYLEVFESIYSVYGKTIEESRGGSTWVHGAGGEGYEGFDTPKELLDENKWKAVKPTNPSMYGSSFEEIKTVDQKENGSNTKEISTQEDLLEQITGEENNDEVILNLVRYFEANKMNEKESLLLTQQILEINKDAQVVAELARLLINAGQNKDFAVSLLKDKKEYTGDDFSFEVFDEIKAELIGADKGAEEESTSKEDNDTSQVKVTIAMMQQGFDGKGLFEAPDGSKYEGDFKAGRFSGKGKMIWPDGESYDGDWKDSNPNGKGIYNFANGDLYDGEFKKGERHGSGKCTWGPGDWEGDVYEGEWKNDQKSGHGVITFGSGEFKGEKYDGQWKDGKRNGKGTYDFADGTSFIGTWKDGELVEKEVELKTENKVLSKDASIWEIIQHEFINLDKESVVKKDFSEMILKKYSHIKKGTLGAQISIQVINKRGRTSYAQCSKERVCGDNKYDFLFENDDKTLCKYDKDKHGIWEIYKREDGKLDVRSNEIMPTEKKLVDNWKDNLAQYGLTEESVLELFGPDLSDLADRQHGQVQIFDISPVDLKQCIKDKYVSASLKSIGKCRYGDWEALSLFLSEEEVSYEKREYEKLINELREECTNSGVDPAAQEFQPALVLLFCDGKYIFTGISRGPDL